MKKMTHTIIFALCSFISACQAGYDDKLDDYIGRLENILKVETTELEQITPIIQLPRFPDKSHTQYRVNSDQTSSIGILDFLSLNECAIQQTIAARNNSLGKVASTSQILLNTIAFIQESPACADSLVQKDKTVLLDKLIRSTQQKQQQLPTLLWQAIFNEAEYRRFWKTSNIDFHYPNKLPPQQEQALQNLLQFSQDVLHKGASEINLEEALGIIRLGDGGQLLHAYSRLYQQLDIANQLIEQALQKPFCYPGNPHPKVNILRNTINVFFIPEIQQFSNALNQRYLEIMPTLLFLETLHTQQEHPLHRAWRLQRNELFTVARNATKQHVQMINQLYEQCRLKPGNNPQ